jgi:hypothetical protein
VAGGFRGVEVARGTRRGGRERGNERGRGGKWYKGRKRKEVDVPGLGGEADGIPG